MLHICKSKNKKDKLQFRVLEISDRNGKSIGSETKLNTKNAAWKNILAKMSLYTSVAVNVQDNTIKLPVVYTLYGDGTKHINEHKSLQKYN